MAYFIFILLFIICLLILIFISYSQKIAKVYDLVLVKHSLIYKAIRNFSNYLKENYPDLDTFDYLNDIDDQSDLKEKLDDIFNYDFDDESNLLKDKINDSIKDYNEAFKLYQDIITKYPKTSKILNYHPYHDYSSLVK